MNTIKQETKENNYMRENFPADTFSADGVARQDIREDISKV